MVNTTLETLEAHQEAITLALDIGCHLADMLPFVKGLTAASKAFFTATKTTLGFMGATLQCWKNGSKIESQVTPNPQNACLHENYKNDLWSQDLSQSTRTGSGQKSDTYHRSATFGVVGKEKLYRFEIVGNDGKSYQLFQKKGSLNDEKGIFEYIRNSDNNITHQTFIKGGKITGTPNQKNDPSL